MQFKKIPLFIFVLITSSILLISISQAENRKKTYSQKEIEDIEKQTEKQLDNKTTKINPPSNPNNITVKPEVNAIKTPAGNITKTTVKPADNITKITVKSPDNVTKIMVKPQDNSIKTPIQTVSVEDVGGSLDGETAEIRVSHSNLLAFASLPDEPASFYPELKRGKLAYGLLNVLSSLTNDNSTPLSYLTAPLPNSTIKKDSLTVAELLNRASSEIQEAGLSVQSGITKPYVLTRGNDFSLCPADGGTLYGIFIGVQTYKMDTSMVNSYSKNDVLDLQNSISNLCSNTSIHVFVDDNATIGGIYENLANIKQVAGKKDSFLFYYSGFSSIRDGIGYMFLADTINDKVLIKNTSLDFNSLFDFSQTLRVSNIMFFVDTAALVRELQVIQQQQP
ncbi:MAG: hypothetical protein HQK88_06710 [Nitrospirae bacterium]|nr:hypothetical protein [Nitrospirota bacterium]MBF0534818.1 hypothetical protein [Nitrospirota bacterium]MBF0616492.1 hypothetical protein [Nitrospirota bacterium]